jgi:F-type H+-transporting ATPase subunit beta
VAEQFTGTPGIYVPIDETVRSFREVLDGKHDELPESAFFMKGGIDAVVDAASKGSGGRREEPKAEEAEAAEPEPEEAEAENGDEGADDAESGGEEG